MSSAAVNEEAKHTWEDTAGGAVWESAIDEDGNIRMPESNKAEKKRQNDYSQRHQRLVRDMIRYLYIVIDASRHMRQKDPILPPSTLLDATVRQLLQFLPEYYDQNPLGHLGFIVARNGEAEILSPLSTNRLSHKLALEALADQVAVEGPTQGGELSLQNALQVASQSLCHQPQHGSREIVILMGALSTCDPGFVLDVPLEQARVSTLALVAEVHVCRQLAEQTKGTLGVCLDAHYFHDWLAQQCVPPPKQGANLCNMVPMGFPTRFTTDVPLWVHPLRLARTMYVCPQCQAKNASVPSDCAVCGLPLVLAPHLARSFHHLFPVPVFEEVQRSKATTCFGCHQLLEQRYQCPDCEQVYCHDCDIYLHETLHNCPGCLQRQG